MEDCVMTNDDLFSLYRDKKTVPFGSPEYVHLYASGKEIILYGAGKYGQEFFEENEKSHTFKITAWVDKDFKKKTDELKRQIDSPDVIKKCPNPIIFSLQ